MIIIELKYHYCGEYSKRESRTVDLYKGSIIYWLIDKFIKYKLRKLDKYNKVKYIKSKEYFSKFKEKL